MKRILALFLIVSVCWCQFSNVTTLEHDTAYGARHIVQKIGDTHVILTYLASGSTPKIKIFSVNQSTWALTQIATHDIATSSVLATASDFVVIDETRIIVALEGVDSDGFIVTLSVSGDKTTIAELNSLEHQGEFATLHQIQQIDATHFLVVYNKSTAPVGTWAKVFSIDGGYVITEGDSLLIYNSYVYSLRLERRGTNNQYLVSYGSGSTTTGVLLSLSVNGSYQITREDTLQTSWWRNGETALEMINDTTIVTGFNNPASTTMDLKTYHINPTTYVLTELDSIRADIVADNSIFDIIKWESNNDFVLVWSDNDDDGRFRSYRLNESYVITEQADEFEYTTNSINSARAVQYNNSLFVVGISRFGTDGEVAIKEFIPASLGWAHQIMGVETPTAVNSTSQFTKVSGVE